MATENDFEKHRGEYLYVKNEKIIHRKEKKKYEEKIYFPRRRRLRREIRTVEQVSSRLRNEKVKKEF